MVTIFIAQNEQLLIEKTQLLLLLLLLKPKYWHSTNKIDVFHRVIITRAMNRCFSHLFDYKYNNHLWISSLKHIILFKTTF